jgi:hypothetical protein
MLRALQTPGAVTLPALLLCSSLGALGVVGIKLSPLSVVLHDSREV